MNRVQNISSRTAILLFAQSSKLESAIKPIATSKKKNDVLWHKMNQKVLQKIHKTKLPFFISDENTQEGTRFGEKLSHAVQAVFNEGYEKVIIVGNDTPGLTIKDIQQAAASLENNELVLGPDHRGGAYLIGISKNSYNRSLFARVNWKTSKVVQELKAFSNEPYAVLKPLSDFNTFADFTTILRDLSYLNRIKSNLLSLLFFQLFLNRFIGAVYTYNVLGFNFNKGSPAVG
jgi:glycosyltransferase A (GT-A) superfamily protein (DUF2064 family)